MTKDQKIIKGKVGLLELARQLGNRANTKLDHVRSNWEYPSTDNGSVSKSPLICGGDQHGR
jgi:hypothetical protein